MVNWSPRTNRCPFLGNIVSILNSSLSGLEGRGRQKGICAPKQNHCNFSRLFAIKDHFRLSGYSSQREYEQKSGFGPRLAHLLFVHEDKP
jgi:hypothetical protein